MPERIAKLKATIAELEAELEALESVDQETRAVLEEALRDINAALRKQAHDELGDHSLSGRLRHAAESLESSHPTLFGIVSRIIDGLGQMGI